MQTSKGENWKFPEIDRDMSHKCPNVRFHKGKKVCIIFKRTCSGWSLRCALRGMKVKARLYNLWKEKGYIQHTPSQRK